MDKNKISGIIENALSSISYKELTIALEENDVVNIEIVSNEFKGIRLLKRIARVSDLCKDASMNELQNLDLVFIPVTENEKKLGISETDISIDDLSSSNKISAKTKEALY